MGRREEEKRTIRKTQHYQLGCCCVRSRCTVCQAISLLPLFPRRIFVLRSLRMPFRKVKPSPAQRRYARGVHDMLRDGPPCRGVIDLERMLVNR